MTPEAKRLIKDYLKRWKWVWALLMLCHLGLALAYSMMPEGSTQSRLTILGSAAGALLLAAELRRSPMQVALTLPLSLRDTGRALWWMCIGVPGILLTVLNLLALGIAYALTGRLLPLPLVGAWLLCNWGTLGLYLFMLAKLPRTSRQQNHAEWQGVIAGLAIGAFMPAAMFGVPTSGNWFTVALGLGVFGLFCVIRFYGSMDQFILRSMQRTEDGNSAPTPATGKPMGKGALTGWQYLVWQHAKQTFSFGVVFLALVSFLTLYVFKGGKVELNAYLPMMVIMGVAFSLPWYHAARIFRMLPVDTFRLACVFEFLSIIPTLVMIALSAALIWIWGTLDWYVLWRSVSLIVALQSLIPAICLRWGGKPSVQFLVFFFLITTMSIGTNIFGEIGTSLTVLMVSALVAIIVGFTWTRYELAKGSKAYESRPPLPGMALAGNR